MRIIGLLPVKNEAWILKTTLPQLKQYVDEIIVLEGGSIDETREILTTHHCTIIGQQNSNVHYSAWRQVLLDEGRKRGGSHFVWLDADEAFTSNFLNKMESRLLAMKPGQKLILDWLTLWKSPYQYRSDTGSLAKLSKDFVFCDDGISTFEDSRVHEGRTPGCNEPTKFIRIPRDEGAVLHFQAVPFRRFQIKQAFMQCREWLLKMNTDWEINEKYSVTAEGPFVSCKDVPYFWIDHFQHLDQLSDTEPGHYLDDLLKLFDTYGLRFFEPMNIWQIPEFRHIFFKNQGREPVPATKPILPIRLMQKITKKTRRLM